MPIKKIKIKRMNMHRRRYANAFWREHHQNRASISAACARFKEIKTEHKTPASKQTNGVDEMRGDTMKRIRVTTELNNNKKCGP